jgi:hypothetical protein
MLGVYNRKVTSVALVPEVMSDRIGGEVSEAVEITTANRDCRTRVAGNRR